MIASRIFFFSLHCFCLGASGSPFQWAAWHRHPLLALPDSDHLFLDSGEALALRCFGDRQLRWTFPIHVGEDRVNVTSRVAANGSQHEHESVFVLRDLVLNDVGRYYCVYVNGEPFVNASVFLYVNDSSGIMAPYGDPSHPIHMQMSIQQNRRNVIPCLPARPGVRMTLLTSAGTKADDVRFEPHEGFVVLYPSTYFTGRFECRAALGDELQVNYVLLLFVSAGVVPIPTLGSDHDYYVLAGESPRLTCTVNVEIGGHIHVDWITPGQSHSKSTIKNFRELSRSGTYEIFRSTFLLVNASPADSGFFTCNASNLDFHKSESLDLKILEEPLLKLHSFRLDVSDVEGSDVKMIADVTGYPRPRLAWFHGDGDGDGDGGRVDARPGKFSLKQTNGVASLTILRIATADAGRYTLRDLPEGKESLTFTLKVSVPPSVTFNGAISAPFYQYNVNVALHCLADGIPEPQISFSWQLCDADCISPNATNWQSITESPNEHWSVADNWLKLTPLASGFYRCTARSEVGASSAFLPLYVTDGDEPVSFYPPLAAQPLRLVHGEALTLDCRSQRHNFYSPQMLYQRHDGDDDDDDDESKFVTNSTGHLLIPTSSENSHILELQVAEVAHSDAGFYKCQAELFGGARRSSVVQVVIEEPVAPFVENATPEHYTVNLGHAFSVDCAIFGRPAPELSWFKDGEQLNSTDSLQLTHSLKRLTIKSLEEDDLGEYSCVGENHIGRAMMNFTIYYPEAMFVHQSIASMHIIMIVTGSIAFLALSILILFLFLRHYYRQKSINNQALLEAIDLAQIDSDVPIDEQTENISYDPAFEFPKENLNFGDVIGQGAFGRVLRAEALEIAGKPGRSVVAVKMTKDNSDREQLKALASELKVLIHIRQHVNVLDILGACTKEIARGSLYVIVEYCCHGNLQKYLIKKKQYFNDTMDEEEDVKLVMKHLCEAGEKSAKGLQDSSRQRLASAIEENRPLTTRDLVCFAYQIASGMEYLSAKKYIHRDLAARNILIAQGHIAKISDFGLAKECYRNGAYQKKTNGPVPVKWMAIESLTHRIYTTKGDVWSYGILLWELFSIGCTPYPTMEIDSSFIESLLSGYRMEKPKYARERVYSIMLMCWSIDPKQRPSFFELADFFLDMLERPPSSADSPPSAAVLPMDDYLIPAPAGYLFTKPDAAAAADSRSLEYVPMKPLGSLVGGEHQAAAEQNVYVPDNDNAKRGSNDSSGFSEESDHTSKLLGDEL